MIFSDRFYHKGKQKYGKMVLNVRQPCCCAQTCLVLTALQEYCLHQYGFSLHFLQIAMWFLIDTYCLLFFPDIYLCCDMYLLTMQANGIIQGRVIDECFQNPEMEQRSESSAWRIYLFVGYPVRQWLAFLTRLHKGPYRVTKISFFCLKIAS